MTTLIESLRTVAAALDALADALASGRPDRVLAAEPALATAVSRLRVVRPFSGEDRLALRGELRALRAALARCERMGRTSGALERLVHPQAYGRGPQSAAAAPSAGVPER